MGDRRGGEERPVKAAGSGEESEGSASKQGAPSRPSKPRLPPKRGSVFRQVVADIRNPSASPT